MKTNIEIHQALIDKLRLRADLELTGIGILVENCVVILTGYAGSSITKCVLEQLAKRTAGVRGVVNDIQVYPPQMRERTDAVIACTAVRALEQCAHMPLDRVNVVVSNSWVTLDGEVERYDQCEDAEEAVRQIVGVTGVTNLIVVRPTLGLEDIKPEIEARLKGGLLNLRPSALRSRFVTARLSCAARCARGANERRSGA